MIVPVPRAPCPWPLRVRLAERAEDDPLEHPEQVVGAQDHARGRRARPRAGSGRTCPARIGNSPTNPFRPGTAAEPSAARMKKKARSGSRFQRPPSSAISRVW